jgi:uncharacterized membrane protein
MDILAPGFHAAPNLHPMFVHFPIVLWLTALVLWIIALIRKSDELWRLGRWLLYAGTLAVLVAIGTGLAATDQMGHDAPGHEMVHVHRNLMLITTGLAVVATGVAWVWRHSTSTSPRRAQLGLLVITTIVMTLGADRGAELVFRYGIGTAGTTPVESDQHTHGHGATEHGPAASNTSLPLLVKPPGASAPPDNDEPLPDEAVTPKTLDSGPGRAQHGHQDHEH